MPRSRSITRHGVVPNTLDPIPQTPTGEPFSISDVSIASVINTGPLTKQALNNQISDVTDEIGFDADGIPYLRG